MTMTEPTSRTASTSTPCSARSTSSKGQPELAEFTFRASNTWMDGTYSRTTFGTFSGRRRRPRAQGDLLAGADHPAVLIGSDEAPTPVEYLLHAIAALPHRRHRQHRGRPRRGAPLGDLDHRGRHRPAAASSASRTRSATATTASASTSTSTARPRGRHRGGRRPVAGPLGGVRRAQQRHRGRRHRRLRAPSGRRGGQSASRHRAASSGWPASSNPGPPARAGRPASSSSALGPGQHRLASSTAAGQAGPSHGRRTAVRGELRAGVVEAADRRVGDRGRHGDHDLAEVARVRAVERRQGVVGDRGRGLGVRGRRDQRAVDPLQQVPGERRPPGQRERLGGQPLGRGPVADGQVDLGEPLQRVGEAGVGVERPVQVHRPRRGGLGPRRGRRESRRASPSSVVANAAAGSDPDRLGAGPQLVGHAR